MFLNVINTNKKSDGEHTPFLEFGCKVTNYSNKL